MVAGLGPRPGSRDYQKIAWCLKLRDSGVEPTPATTEVMRDTVTGEKLILR